MINAFYSPIENSIQFPAGILQGVFFNSERPRYMNYGAIGWVIGHEITHGFDDQGRQFDKDGNLLDWWQEETKQKYLARTKCVISQYANYSLPELGNLVVNGVSTQVRHLVHHLEHFSIFMHLIHSKGENVADNGGIKQAYNAYSEYHYIVNEWPLDTHLTCFRILGGLSPRGASSAWPRLHPVAVVLAQWGRGVVCQVQA